jgi:hypothetical protein
VPVLIRPAGPAGRMSTGTERGGIRMIFQGLRGLNSTLTLLDEGSYTLVGAVGFLILSSAMTGSAPRHIGDAQAAWRKGGWE